MSAIRNPLFQRHCEFQNLHHLCKFHHPWFQKEALEISILYFSSFWECNICSPDHTIIGVRLQHNGILWLPGTQYITTPTQCNDFPLLCCPSDVEGDLGSCHGEALLEVFPNTKPPSAGRSRSSAAVTNVSP